MGLIYVVLIFWMASSNFSLKCNTFNTLNNITINLDENIGWIYFELKQIGMMNLPKETTFGLIRDEIKFFSCTCLVGDFTL